LQYAASQNYVKGPIFAPNSCWQAPLPDNAPISPNSSAFVQDFVAQMNRIGPWINIDQYSVPIYVVPASQPKKQVVLDRPSGTPTVDQLKAAWKEVPIPDNAHPANGTDKHLVIWQPSTNQMWEFWAMDKTTNSSGVFWVAQWGGFIADVSNSPGFFQAPNPTWGATATSLMLAGGLMLISEAQQYVIPHALAYATADFAPWNVVAPPAQRSDGDGKSIIPEGTRFRLPHNVDLSHITTPLGKAMAIAIRDYGLLCRDTAGAAVVYGEDPTPYGTNPWPAIMNNGWANNIMKEIPWNQLQVVSPSWAPWDKNNQWYQPI
jgi:hypothetical protein